MLTSCGVNKNDNDAIATMVAATLSTIPSATTTPSPTTPSVLPRSLYYQVLDGNSKGQIYRLSRDGSTTSQITHEPEGVAFFDISLLDGAIVYQSNQQILLADLNGENQRVIVQDQISSAPFWSPDGKNIAYGAKGSIYLYSTETGTSTPLIFGNTENGDKYSPRDFSPDGSELIVSISGAGPYSTEVYDMASKTFVPIPLQTMNRISWLADSKQIFIFSSVAAGGKEGIMLPGLWRYNAENGSGGVLVQSGNSGSDDGNDCVEAPMQEPDGHLIYLYGTEHPCTQPTLFLVRTAQDGVTNRLIIRPETFHAMDASWTPEKNALVIIQNNGVSSRPTNLLFVPIDPSLPVIALPVDDSKLGWNPLQWGLP